MSRTTARRVLRAAMLLVLLAGAAGCESDGIRQAARSGAATFVNTVLTAAVNEAIVE